MVVVSTEEESLMRDYKNLSTKPDEYLRDTYYPNDEPPLHVALSCVVFAALCAVVLTAPTWLAWIEGVCR
jgi:hypothetical protein